MKEITDQHMMEMLNNSKPYTIVILKAGPNSNMPGEQQIVWEHGRRNFSLREQGLLNIVCPVMDGSEVNGIAIFNTDMDKTIDILEDDPGIKAGIFIYEIHPTLSFAGDKLL